MCGAVVETYSKSGIAREYGADRLRRMQLMRSIGEWASENTTPDALIACRFIGAIGYYSGRPILDMHGLTDLHIAHLPVANMGTGMAGHEKEDLEYVLERRPDYVFVNLKKSRYEDATRVDEAMGRLLESYDQLQGTYRGHAFFYYRARRGSSQ